MKGIADLVAEAGGGDLASEMALRDHVRNLLQSGDAGRSEIASFLQTASPRAWLTLDESMRAQWYGGFGEAPAAQTA